MLALPCCELANVCCIQLRAFNAAVCEVLLLGLCCCNGRSNCCG
jgi:hypothetical protein